MTREEAIKRLKEARSTMQPYRYVDEAIDYAIKALEQEPILDKIRDEIEQITSRYTVSRERDAMGQVEWSDRLIKESEILEILDKYKAESDNCN